MARNEHSLEFGPLRRLDNGCFAMTGSLTAPGGTGRYSQTVECGSQMASARSPEEIASLMRQRLTAWSVEVLGGLD